MRQLLKKGQAALIVLLVVAVALGFGLSIISQTTTDIRISQQEQEAARAFNAAEAGIEEALRKINVGTTNIEVGDVKVEYTVSEENSLQGVFKENEAAQVVLGGVDSILRIQWVDRNSELENPGDCTGGVKAESGQTAASLLISVISVIGDSSQIRREGWNACNLEADNGMTNVTDSDSGTFLRSYDLAIDASDSLVRIRPVYNQTSLRVTGSPALPVQSYVIDSKARALTLESKAIEVTRTEPATPAIFDYVLFSGTNIIK
jgi:Tfp pilus assembly protein PilX